VNIRIKQLIGLVMMVAGFAALLPGSLGSDAAAAQSPYAFATIDFPNASKTFAMGNNASGDIVGYYIADNQTHGFLSRQGVLTTLDYPGADATSTQANAINDAGDIVGTYSLTSGPKGNVHGFRRTSNGEWSTVDLPEETHLMAGGGFAIAADGTIFGCVHDGAPITAMHGYRLGSEGASRFDYPADAPSAMHYGVTPDGETIVGSYVAGKNQPDNWHGYVLNGGKTVSFDVPGELGTNALGAGQSPGVTIVGTYKVQVGSAWNQHGYVAATNGSMDPAAWQYTRVDVPDATQTIVRGVNASGDLVGTYFDASGGVHGFMTTRAAAPGAPNTGAGLAQAPASDGPPLFPVVLAAASGLALAALTIGGLWRRRASR
jgi:hypothetical protein